MAPRRILAAALPHLAAEARLRRDGQAGFPRPFALAGPEGGALRLASVNPAAAAAGLAPGQGLADARAICPGLVTRPAEPERLAAFRRALARWAGRFSPLAAMEEETLVLDATGAAHLFGGEAAMAVAVEAGLAEHGLTARAAMADTRGAAWALAWFGGHKAPGREEARAQAPAPLIAPRGRTRAAIGALPVAALRLEPEAAAGLAALGLTTIEDAARIPRGALARRFGLAAMKRLDQALGAEPEPVSPDRPAPVFAVRLTLPEPVGHVDDVTAGLERLLERLCQALEREQMGARALRLTARRVDRADAHAAIALARPGRDPARIRELFARKVAGMEAGYGIDALRLEATAVEPLKPAQPRRASGPARDAEKLADLLSNLGNRIGFESLIRLLPAESHIPERAFTLAAAAWAEPEPFAAGGPARPLTLFPPERVEVAAVDVPRGGGGGDPEQAPAPPLPALPPEGGGDVAARSARHPGQFASAGAGASLPPRGEGWGEGVASPRPPSARRRATGPAYRPSPSAGAAAGLRSPGRRVPSASPRNGGGTTPPGAAAPATTGGWRRRRARASGCSEPPRRPAGCPDPDGGCMANSPEGQPCQPEDKRT